MRLKKLELFGFKSFMGRTEIVFDGGITGIVGPNGSGKSNIGDAIRWVLGEQSAKTLRGTSMADVIFGGTQKRKPAGFCEVSLIFDNTDGALKPEYSEIMVTRRVWRNGESEYYLNRTACRLKDIVDLFRDTGVGKEGYSIIGQGRIDEILSRKSEDRRLVFEEAAGIVKFRTRKEEADRKLERTRENLVRVDDILEELTHRLKPLEKQADNARVYLELSAELKTLELNLFLIRSDKFRDRMNELDASLLGLKDAVAATSQALNEKTLRRDETQQEISRLDESVSVARDTLMSCSDDVHEAMNALSAMKIRRETRQENRERLLEEKRRGEEALALLQGTDTVDMQRQEELLAEAEQLLQQEKIRAERAAQAEQEADAALEEHKQQVINAMNRLSSLRNDFTRLHTMQNNLQSRLTEIEQSDAVLKSKEQAYVSALEEASQRLNDEKKLLGEHLAAYRMRQAEKEQADADLRQLRDDAEELSAQLQAMASRYHVLEEMSREMEGFGQAVRRAAQYARNRGISGMMGVLAQLIEVPKEYEVAIDMALGAAQQNIVTDNEETAKELIGYLRENRLGRATFLPMTSVRSKLLNDRERQVLGMPGCLGVASDLVRCDDRFRGIVENLLGRTVLADNLDHGIAIQRKSGHSFRLVTLTGDVMHSGGSMTGGSVAGKVANLFSRGREMKELEEKIRSGKQKLQQMKEQLLQGQEEKNHRRELINAALEDYHQQEIAVARETEREDSARNELNSHRERMEETAQAILQIHESLQDIGEQLDSLEKTDADKENDQAAMEERTVVLQEALVRRRREAQESSDRVMSRTIEVSDLRHVLDSARRDEERKQQDIQHLTEEAARREEQLRQLQLQDAADEQAISETEELAEQRRAVQTRQEEMTDMLEQRRRAMQERLTELMQDMENLHEAHERDADKIHRVELQRARVENDLRTMENRIWDTYELTYAGAEEFRITEGFDTTEADHRAASLNSRIRALGTVNVNAVEEYADTKQRHDELLSQRQDLEKAEKDLAELIEMLLKQMSATFVTNFAKLQEYFSETFVRLFGGGHAELKLQDPSDPLNCGIEINAQPPGKKLQLLSLLSGGERALCAIAILFATLKLKPTPFCVLDEIEAALDDANIGYYADYLKEYSQGTQFIVVTHRKGTMERCNSLYGVAMEEQGVSKMVSVSLKDYQ